MQTTESEAAFALCLLAAFADGDQSEEERVQLKRVIDRLAAPDFDTARIHQDILTKRTTIQSAVGALTTPEARNLAYEMAVCVCDADDVLNSAEHRFLGELRTSLGLDAAAVSGFEREVESVAAAPLAVAGSPPLLAAAEDPDIDRMILNYAILNAALELLPASIATMAVVPLQMKMVYRIGQRHGHTLDRGHIGELLGAAGVGLTSQVVEGYARKLLGGLFGKFGGGLGRAIGSQTAGSAVTFATTWALGHLAQRYYSGGRTLSALQLRELFNSLTGQASGVYDRSVGAIQAKAAGLDISQLANLVRGR